jgi:predicted ATPase
LPVDACEGVSSLLDKSLLGQEEGPGGEPRFVMLETVHEFAREKLERSWETEEIKRVHAEYFLTLAEEAYPELKGPDQLEWLEHVEAEHDNMRAALSWALERREAELALRLGALCGGSGGCGGITARADAGSKRPWRWTRAGRLGCGRWYWPR